MSEQEAHEVVSGHEEVGKVNATLGISRRVEARGVKHGVRYGHRAAQGLKVGTELAIHH